MPDSSQEGLPENQQNSGTDVQNSTSSESSTGGSQDGKQPSETLVDRLKTVVAKKQDGGTSSGSGEVADSKAGDQKAQGGDKSTQGGQDDGELSEVEIKALSAKTQNRIRTLVKQRDEAQAAAKQVDTYRQGAEAFDRMHKFVQKAGLSSDEVNTGLNIMRAMKNNPAEALELLTPYITQLNQVVGEVLPADLQAKVQKGEIDEATAKELSRSRAANRINTDMNTRNAEQQQIQRQTDFANSVGAAMSAWESNWKQTDPDYAVLQPYVSSEIELRLRRGEVPRSVQEAQAMGERILGEVRAKLKKFKPAPTEIKHAAGGTQPTNLPKPKSLIEAMTQAVGR